MKICFVSRGDLNLFPPTQGGSVKIFNTVKYLSLLGSTVYFVTSEHDVYFEVKNGKWKKKEYPKSLSRKVFLKKSWKRILSFLGVPEEEHVLFHPLFNHNLFLKALYVAKKEKVDLLHAEFLSFAFPLLLVKMLIGRKLVLVEHNVECKRMEEIFKLNIFTKTLLRSLESVITNLSDVVIVVTEEDKRRLEKLLVKRSKIHVVPHGVDVERFERGNGERIKEKLKLSSPVIIFHGVLYYKPNADAVDRIAEIASEVKKHLPEASFLIVGEKPPTLKLHENLIYTGVVKNLEDYIGAADIAIVPLKAGGGMRMKILEYFAAKKPVISTPKGAEGIDVESGREIILCSIEDFPSKIIELWKNLDLRESITKNAFEFVKKLHWRNICKKYVNLYRRLL